MKAAVGILLLVAIMPAAHAEDIYAGVGPSTYCLWKRTGLPPAQQRICADRDRTHPTKTAEWKRFEADNGAGFVVDMNSITNLGNSSVLVVLYVEQPHYQPKNLRRYWFDCRDHYYRDETEGLGDPIYAPPRSVAAHVAEAACMRGTALR